MNKLKLESIISAVAIYLIIVIGIFFGAIYEPATPKSKTYVAKKSDIIEVSLGSLKKTTAKSKQHKKPPKKKKKPTKKTVKKKPPKKIRNVKKPTKKVTKKVVKHSSKKPSKKVTKKSKPDTSSLFKNIASNIADDSPEPRTAGKSGKSSKKVDKGKGVVNAYFAKIQHTLEGWPAQNNFAGEKVKVELTVYSSGLFDYKILSRSLNPEFNRALKGYLEQLKRFGFGVHSNPKPYKIIVEFIAKG